MRVAGHDHVGIGGDLDGINVTVEGLGGADGYPLLFAELIRRGWSDTNLAKLAGGNVLRALRRAEAVPASLKAAQLAGARQTSPRSSLSFRSVSHGSRFLILAALLAGIAVPAFAADVAKPAALTADGMPAVPDTLAAASRPYMEARSAGFAGWNARDRSMLIATRFGNVAQLHKVAAPLMACAARSASKSSRWAAAGPRPATSWS